MPSTGIPSSSSSGSSRGAPGAYTDAGPPDRISPFGARLRTSPAPTWCGSSSLNTPHSRTRRAISCEYWPPKSRTSTSSVAAAGDPEVAGAAACLVLTRLLDRQRRIQDRAVLRYAVGRRVRHGRRGGPHADFLLALQ